MTGREGTPQEFAAMFGARPAEQPEPPASRDRQSRLDDAERKEVEGLPPKDKHVSDYTPAERDAQHAETARVLRQRERDEQAAEERREAEANRTPDQLFGDALRASLQPGAKQARNRAFFELLHPPGKQ